jgi:outer membrane protein, multidrug efflux system
MTSYFNYTRRYYAILPAILLLFTISCNIRPQAPVANRRSLPAQYIDSISTGDTTSAATISWKKFFADPGLINLIDRGIQYNPQLKIATQRIAIARTQLMTAQAALLPTLQGSLTFGADRFGRYTMNGVGNFDTNFSPDISKDQRIPEAPYTEMFVGLRSTWEIDIWKKLGARKKAAVAKLAAIEEERKLTQTLLVSEIAQGYYTLLALDYEIEVLQRNIGLQQNELELMKVQKEAGRATELAIKQFSAQLLRTQSMEYVIRQQIAITENQLCFLTGAFPGQITRGNSLMQTPLPEAINTGLPAALLTRRPDIRSAEWQLQAAGANIEAARAAYLPQLTLSPYIGLSAFNPRLLLQPGSVAAGALSGLSAPLFQQKQIRAGFRISVAEQELAQLEYEQLLLRAMREVVTDLKALENLRASYSLKSREVEELRRGVSIAGDLYNSGFATYLEIITAQRNVLDAELQQVSLKNEMLKAAVDLYRSLGGGWE